MKYTHFLLISLFISCTGSLTDDQRKKIKEDMARNEIKKVTDAEIIEAAMRIGQKIALAVEIEDKTLSNQSLLDSIGQFYQVEIQVLHEGNPSLRSVERKILEAYSSGGGDDNIQKMGPDSLLYTKPFPIHKNGESPSNNVLGIRMTKKQIVLTIK